ncbi:hypothetical protein COHA_006528 [Chlorella ohadii]|uniref:RRM domain-containing protein n=1 Tax=Chlorella ohadii TaxID=2649997 RepID=A0AAD5DNU6_9CHLO|nr:hypothetical protein COHA_006528 [Chlorella ohadii]
MQHFHDPHISPQFTRPTKVIHFRNLPFDLTGEEIREFCAPWGTVVAVKEKVGANKNQCFVEFASIDQALSIVNHYASSANPASFRGRPTWLSYSGRDKLTNVSPTSDTPTPVLQVTVTNIAPDLAQSGAINLDLLNVVFGAFGFVKKVIVYNKPEGGLIAWLQFLDATTAAQVRQTLQGQQIPRNLVNDHPNPPVLEMVFSSQPDLNIRTQSYCTRDFMNAALPWGDPDWNYISALLPVGPEGASNVLSVSFDSMTYPVTVDGIHTIFSTYGTVQKVHIFEREGKTVALVQYPDVRTADMAKQALEGHAMYDGGHNVMHVTYSKHRNLRPYGAPPAAAPQQQAYAAPPPTRQHYDPNVVVTGEDFVRQHERVLQQAGGRTAGPPGAPSYGAPAVSVLL